MKAAAKRSLPHRLRRWLLLNAALALYWVAVSGRYDYWSFWIYFAAFSGATLCGAVFISPELQEERLHPGPGGKDYFLRNATFPLLILHWTVAALDTGRLHLTDAIPLTLKLLAFPPFLGGLALWHWALLANPFYSSVVRIQPDRGHHVIRGGPYRLVRHPGYAGGVAVLLAGSAVLGSWLSLLPAATLAALIVRRIPGEESVLVRELPGYGEYAAATRYRMVPYLW